MDYGSELRSAFLDKPIFTRNDFSNYIREHNQTLKDNSVGWLLYTLCRKNVIQRIAHNSYQLYTGVSPFADYSANISDDAATVLRILKQRFPLLTFIVWETRAYNEFANHMLARNIIFVEVEKPLGESVFNELREQEAYSVLFKPNEKEISLYSGDVTVAVLPLTSESPINGYCVRLEKMLVDLFANKLLDILISKSDFAGIYEEAFSRYNVNYSMLLRYAKRRNKEEKVKSFIENHANIVNAGKDLAI